MTHRDPGSKPWQLQPGPRPLPGPLCRGEGGVLDHRARLGSDFFGGPSHHRPGALVFDAEMSTVGAGAGGVRDRAAGWRSFWCNRFGNLSCGPTRTWSRLC